MASDGMVDLRCPVHRRRLFGRVDAADARVEVACDDCRRAQRKMGVRVLLVLHVFDGSGECVDTRVVEGA